ncbi:hypothetical protein AAL_07968 [Moelleriella libera RCEF 2490]|uniref:Uncharacterized protein n=1 Tax=Moelleriella libera RCEF 2490 TaxID=1081109 RepID=A0A167WF56_9HYPO|nr:hypothetical protein AAL_07968 [Moelleriella libera RCEF 2490]
MKSTTFVLAAFASLVVAVPGKRPSNPTWEDNLVLGNELELCDPLDAKIVEKNKCHTDVHNCVDELSAGKQPEGGETDADFLEKVKNCLYYQKKYINPKGDTIRNYLAQYSLENKTGKELWLWCGKHDNDDKHMKCKVFHDSVAFNTEDPFQSECRGGSCHRFDTIIRDCEDSKSGCAGCTHEGIEQFSPKSRTFQCDHDYTLA